MQASNRKQQGFTLVEVIVVAVIVAALAAVSVPLYLNYVTSSRANAAANTAGSVASFMGACRNQGGTPTTYNGTTGSTTGSATPAAMDSVVCVITSGQTSVTIPDDILVAISNLVVTGGGTVRALHSSSPSGSTPAVYNY